MEVLITGGAGYIGSTIASAALDVGHRPVILDNLVTGRAEFARGRDFYEGDVGDRSLVGRILEEHPGIDCVVHCAALTVAPESVSRPLDYYQENLVKTLDLVETLTAWGVPRLVFSSSAAIYAPDDHHVVDESSPWAPASPYARSKAMAETVVRDVAAAGQLRVMSLRYFNPIGADPQLRTGLQVPRSSSVLARLMEAYAEGEAFPVHGSDYPTRDGTAIRDYVHVWDLAAAHVAAIERFDDALGDAPYLGVNLGTGTGTTVLELVEAFGSVVGSRVAVRRTGRRPGDVVGAFTRAEGARDALGWTAVRSLETGIRDSLAWRERRAEVLLEPDPMSLR